MMNKLLSLSIGLFICFYISLGNTKEKISLFEGNSEYLILKIEYDSDASESKQKKRWYKQYREAEKYCKKYDKYNYWFFTSNNIVENEKSYKFNSITRDSWYPKTSSSQKYYLHRFFCAKSAKNAVIILDKILRNSPHKTNLKIDGTKGKLALIRNSCKAGMKKTLFGCKDYEPPLFAASLFPGISQGEVYLNMGFDLTLSQKNQLLRDQEIRKAELKRHAKELDKIKEKYQYLVAQDVIILNDTIFLYSINEPKLAQNSKNKSAKQGEIYKVRYVDKTFFDSDELKTWEKKNNKKIKEGVYAYLWSNSKRGYVYIDNFELVPDEINNNFLVEDNFSVCVRYSDEYMHSSNGKCGKDMVQMPILEFCESKLGKKNGSSISKMFRDSYCILNLNNEDDNYIDNDNERIIAEEKKLKELEEKRKAEEKRLKELEEKRKAEEKRLAEQKKKEEEKEKLYSVSSGTGFFITDNGYVVTNNHVTNFCNTSDIHYNGLVYETVLIANDPINDLSLLKANLKTNYKFYFANDDIGLLEDIYIAGFPFGYDLSTSVKVTQGIVSALSGLENNFSRFQVDAALQKGNSGGPIIDMNGNVVGVAVEKANYKYYLENYEDMPENLNFGIKLSTLQTFLKSNGIQIDKKIENNLTKSEVGKLITNATVYVDCLMTEARYHEVESKNQKVLFKKIK